jgi:short-subunit dehydrogenase
MRGRREGRIVNIASIGGLIPLPHLVPYAASKAALVGLSRGLATELGRDGIVVTTICPGLMRTGSPRNARFKGEHRAEYAWFSVGDSLPVTSMKAERAADRIILAIERSERFVVIGLQARLAHLAAAIFPNLFVRAAAAVNRLLPASGGIGTEAARGYESGSNVSPSVLTSLSERAAERNHELDYRPR